MLDEEENGVLAVVCAGEGEGSVVLVIGEVDLVR